MVLSMWTGTRGSNPRSHHWRGKREHQRCHRDGSGRQKRTYQKTIYRTSHITTQNSYSLIKRTALIKYLLENNCILFKEGSNHSVYINKNGKGLSAVPRHSELGDRLAVEICKQLGIPKIKWILLKCADLKYYWYSLHFVLPHPAQEFGIKWWICWGQVPISGIKFPRTPNDVRNSSWPPIPTTKPGRPNGLHVPVL